jgi:hypothetical protein
MDLQRLYRGDFKRRDLLLNFVQIVGRFEKLLDGHTGSLRCPRIRILFWDGA